MSVLNVPIQINRGNSGIASTYLKEGEPYINLSNKVLYVGGGSDPHVNISGYSATTNNLTYESDSHLVSLDRYSGPQYLGGFQIRSTATNVYSFQPVNTSVYVTLSGMYINNLRTTTLMAGEMYGNNFPSNPVTGQLFFKIV